MNNSDGIVLFNDEMLSRYKVAMKMKAAGDVDGVERLLLASVFPPSIYHGHYRELFVNWRKKLKAHEGKGEHCEVVSLLKMMVKLDGEMLVKMSEHWTPIHGEYRPPGYFQGYSNLNVTDVRKLIKYARILDDESSMLLGEGLLTSLSDKR